MDKVRITLLFLSNKAKLNASTVVNCFIILDINFSLEQVMEQFPFAPLLESVKAD